MHYIGPTETKKSYTKYYLNVVMNLAAKPLCGIQHNTLMHSKLWRYNSNFPHVKAIEGEPSTIYSQKTEWMACKNFADLARGLKIAQLNSLLRVHAVHTQTHNNLISQGIVLRRQTIAGNKFTVLFITKQKFP